MKIPFIDIHTHCKVNSEDIKSICNLFLQDVDIMVDVKFPFSAGIHPWHTSCFSPQQVDSMLNSLMGQPKLMAIGETGLDKVCSANYDLQVMIFELHIKFAEMLRKPLIIHTVKTWNDMVGYLKHLKVPFVLHGYNMRYELTKQILDIGGYFSLGKSVLQITPSLLKSVQFMPLTSLLIESDNSNVEICLIYHEVSKILGISLEELKFQVYENYRTLFFNFESCG